MQQKGDFMKNKLIYFKMHLYRNLYNIQKNNSGMGVIEVVLIILVLVGLALVFRTKINALLTSIFTKVSNNVSKF